MQILQDLFYTNEKVLTSTALSLKKNWAIIFTGLFYTMATIILYILLPHFWILGGLVLILFTSALISNYLHLLDCIVSRNKFHLQDFKEGFTIYLRKVWGVLFIAWVGSLILSTLVMPILRSAIHPILLTSIINFLVLVLLNALPETIYQKHYNPWESLIYTVDFIKDNWIEWFIPNIILMGIMYLLVGNFLGGMVHNRFSIIRIFTYSSGFATYILSQIWLAFMMIYRGYLFEILSTSNRRKRLFMREF
ncbi:MAG: hypothetical protein JJT76_02670 [Clostridiaceae bacterium]|nr:hypothetical protein [Clostridiaceae bacterium]